MKRSSTSSNSTGSDGTGPNGGFSATIVYIDGTTTGLRKVYSLGSRLAVLAAPVAELAHVKRYIHVGLRRLRHRRQARLYRPWRRRPEVRRSSGCSNAPAIADLHHPFR